MRPTVGTWCEDCRVKGHTCQAQIHVDLLPLCLPCADGEPCSVERVAATKKAEATEDMWGEPIPGPVKSLPVTLRPLVDNPKQDAPGRWRAALGPKITEELIAEAHAVPKEQVRVSPTLAQLIDRHRDMSTNPPEIAQKPAAVASQEKSGPVVPKNKRARPVGRPTQNPPLQEKANPVINDEKKVTPAMEVQMRADFLAGLTANAVAKKYKVSWFIADYIRKQARITPAAQIKAQFEAKPEPAPASMKEVFQEIFPAKNPKPEPSVPTATVNGLEFTPPPTTHAEAPCEVIGDTLKPAEPGPWPGLKRFLSEAPAPPENVKAVLLRSGGHVSISTSANLFALSIEDRRLIFGLIDAMGAYEANHSLGHRDAS